MASQQEKARRRICESFEEAKAIRESLGKGNRIYMVPLPAKTVFVVAGSGYLASGIAGVIEGILPEAVHMEDMEESVLELKLRQLQREFDELKFRSRWKDETRDK